MTQRGATVEKVEDNPAWYAGKTVTLTGEVDDVYSPRAFELEGNALLFDSEVLVVTKSPVSVGGRELQDEDDVIVSGKVQRFVTAEVEREAGWDLSPELEMEWSEKAVLFANSVSKFDEYARWEEGDKDAALVSVTAVYYYPDPVKLVGSTLELDSIPVHETAKQGVWVGNNAASRLFVTLPEEQLKGISQGDQVDLSGTIRALPQDKDLGKDWGLSEEKIDSLKADGIYVEGKSVKKRAGGDQQAKAR